MSHVQLLHHQRARYLPFRSMETFALEAQQVQTGMAWSIARSAHVSVILA